MIIYSKSMPGGAYNRECQINASYVCTDSGFMDQSIFTSVVWEDFASICSTSAPIGYALLRKPHITQPLDVTVYEKYEDWNSKINESNKNVLISKKQVSYVQSYFCPRFEKSGTSSVWIVRLSVCLFVCP